MAQEAERDQRAEATRAFIADWLIRHRGMVAVVVCAALLDAGPRPMTPRPSNAS